jgi:hypothetical protein
MKKFRLSGELNESIVDGIIEGYKDYLRVRKEAARNLRVHGAYAWVKGNHIDHHVAVQCEKLGVESKLSKAGVTWQYLQFSVDDIKTLFLIKNARYFDPNAVDRGKDTYGRPKSKKSAYMEEFISINEEVEFPNKTNKALAGHSRQLVLFDELPFDSLTAEEVSEIAKEYDKFYIVTYEIDDEFLISGINLWMPNPSDNKAYLVEDLSAYINTKTSHIIEMEEQTKAILQNSTEMPDASLYDIEIVEDDMDDATGES